MTPEERKAMLMALRAKGMKGHPLYNGTVPAKKAEENHRKAKAAKRARRSR